MGGEGESGVVQAPEGMSSWSLQPWDGCDWRAHIRRGTWCLQATETGGGCRVRRGGPGEGQARQCRWEAALEGRALTSE